MINRRGLSPAEFEEVDDELFQFLMVYDAYIEPSGSKFEMLKHAHLCQTITLNNPNMTRKIAKDINVSDYDFMGILGEGTTKERHEKRVEDNMKENNRKTQDYIQQRMAMLRGNDGKK
ncbi:hypothetical protein RJ495_005099 [Pluralibacter gergoviae]|nr:hypothetical protein [Pluralibacter gergoviae]ELD4303985.1 hypothetical protein [Pluralibacter gergoviae]